MDEHATSVSTIVNRIIKKRVYEQLLAIPKVSNQDRKEFTETEVSGQLL